MRQAYLWELSQDPLVGRPLPTWSGSCSALGLEFESWASLSSGTHLSWAILSVVTLTMAWIRSSLLASSFFFISLVSLQRDKHQR